MPWHNVEMKMSFAQFANEMPKPFWIFFMVVGFIVFWPIGLAVLGYMLWSGKMNSGWSSSKWKACSRSSRRRSTGNLAFDEYREETLRRLEDEQKEFEIFLERLKLAKDQKEFDQFMSEKNGAVSS